MRLLPALAAGLLLGAGQEKSRPNVLFLLADDLRFDTIRELGNPEVVTPTLDRLVREGTAFSRAYIMGGDQPAVCVPSRAMLLTGRPLFQVGRAIPDEVPLWPEVMGQAGYATFGTGKWHNGPRTYARAFAAGANIFFGGMSDQNRVKVYDFDPSGKYPRDGGRIGGKFSTELFVDSAAGFLEEHRGDRPFFLYVSFTSPHDPRTPPKKYADLYDPAKIALPGSFLPEHPFDNGELKVRDELLAPFPRTPEAVRRHAADYYGMISHLDAEIGRLLGVLEKRGFAGNTIVVFAGDNGLAVGRHGLLGKQSLYDHSVHVPLVIRGPGLPQGRRAGAMCYLLDLFPTVCELAGVAAPGGLEGRSLVPVLRGRKEAHREALFFAYRTFQRAVRDERWKLIEYDVAGKRTTQLFDLEADPAETRSLADDSAHAVTLARLRGELARLGKELGDPLAR